ncbi:MAG: YciI family protein [Bacteroidales bacterium]|nr:YciI family protein [Bacteroidales bacterium]
MKWAAIIEYTSDTAKTAAVRPTHRAYLTQLLDAGQLAIAGPIMDDSGAIIVYEADTLEAAEALLRADPFCTSGVFVSWKLRPWKTVFANPNLLPPNG